jgi:hypothetical protein
MKLFEIVEKYQQIKISNFQCIEQQEENIYNLKEKIRESFKSSDLKEVSEKFSELFQIWSTFGDENLNVNDLDYDKWGLELKYKEYSDHFSLFPLHELENRLVASRGIPADMRLSDNKTTEQMLYKLLDFADDKAIQNIVASKEIIEYMLEILWNCLFQNNLASIDNAEEHLNKKQDVDCSEFEKNYHKDWALYELINQVKRYITTLIKEGEIKREKFSTLKEDKQVDILANSSDMCEYILNKYIADDTTIPKCIREWIPKIERKKDLLLPNIIMTSDLVGYMFEYRLKTTIKKNKLKGEASILVTHLYKTLVSGTVIYDAMFNYAETLEEDYIVTYNNKAFYPRVVFNFFLSIIQEVIRQALTKRKENIFNQLSGRYRDDGLSEKKIISKVKSDSEKYFLMYAYFDRPVQGTFKKKRIELESWLESLNTLRFGVIDEYLFELSQATKISYQAKTVTAVVTMKPKI